MPIDKSGERLLIICYLNFFMLFAYGLLKFLYKNSALRFRVHLDWLITILYFPEIPGIYCVFCNNIHDSKEFHRI